MLLNFVRRVQAKKDSALSTSSQLSDLSEEVKESLRQVGMVALKGLGGGQFVFDAKKDVEAMCGDAQQLGLVEEFRTTSLLGDRHEVQFCHLTWQEYMAAYCVLHAEDVEKELYFCEENIGMGEEALPFWQFVAGLLDVRKLNILMMVLIGRVTQSHETWRWLLFKMSCLAEAAQQPCGGPDEEEMRKMEVQESSATSLVKKADFSSCVLSDSELHNVSVALSYAPHIANVLLRSCGLELARLKILNVTGGLQHMERLDCGWNDLHGDKLVELKKGLQHNHRLQVLGLQMCNLDESDCHTLCQILSTNKSLQGVSLQSNPIGKDGHEILWPAVHSSKLTWLGLNDTIQCPAVSPHAHSHEQICCGQCMSNLYMSENNLSTEETKSVLRATQNAMCLSLLDLSRNKIDSSIVNALPAVCTERLRARQESMEDGSEHQPVLFTIRPHGNKVDKEALEWLAKEMPVNSGVRVECDMLIVSGGRVSLRDLSVYFEKYMEGGGKGDLNMRYAGLDKNGAQQVANKLTGDQMLIEALQLDWNSLGDEGAVCLATALRRNSSLRALSLFSNKIGSVGFAALSNALVQSNSVLQVLSVASNPIFELRETDHRVDARLQLGKLLRNSCGLKFVGLARTGLGDGECVEIGDALASNMTNIQFLQVAENKMTDAGVTALCRGLERNTSVCCLDLSRNSLGSNALSAVFRCVEIRNKSDHPMECVWIGDARADVSHLAGVVSTSTLVFSSLTSVLDTWCAN